MQLFSISITFVTFIFFYFFLYESPRWQITNRDYDKAEITIKKALKMNGKSDVNLKENMSKLKKNIEEVIRLIVLPLVFERKVNILSKCSLLGEHFRKVYCFVNNFILKGS